MFKKTRLHLTAVCALATAAVLIVMAAVSLAISLTQLEKQSRESFRSNINTVLYYLQSQGLVDQAWLAQTEADNSLRIRIENRNTVIQYVYQDEERLALTESALRYATESLGFDPEQRPVSSVEADILLFDFGNKINDSRGQYYAGIVSQPYGTEWLTVTVLKDRSEEKALSFQLIAGFAICIAASVVTLTIFAWYFSGKAMKPVEISHQKQTEFIAAASHELRSPLAVISVSAGTIKNSPAHAAGLADKIERECSRMAGLISNLLTLANASANVSAGSGGGSSAILPDSHISPKTLLLNALEHYEELAAERGITLELVLPEATPADLTCNCNQKQIEQILTIFLDNALRFTPEGGRIQLKGSSSKDSRRIYLSVADSGPGVLGTEKSRVFDRFYCKDAARTDKEHYGLGLSIAKEFADLHKADLEVRDSGLGGAEFVLTLRR